MLCFSGFLVLLTSMPAKGEAAEPSRFEPDYPSAVVYPAVNFNSRKGHDISVLILHYTTAPNDMVALESLTTKGDGVSAHYLVFENGTVYQLVQESKRAWHAGVSAWRELHSGLNSASIGIEIQNTGDRYKSNYEPPFPQVQIDSVIALTKSIVSRHNIQPGRVVGHEDVAPGRKPDPGHSFPWKQLFDAGVGAWAETAPIVSGPSLKFGDRRPEVKELQRQLSELGYKLDVDGIFGKGTRACVRAFQRHWRQAKYDGVADSSTIETLRRVVAAAEELYNSRR